MGWPWRRFEAFFARHLARKGAEAITRQRDLMLAAIASNPTWDEPANAEARKSRIDAINEGWCRGVEIVYNGVSAHDPELDPLDHDPLFRALRSQGASAHAAAQRPQMDEEGAGEVILRGR